MTDLPPKLKPPLNTVIPPTTSRMSTTSKTPISMPDPELRAGVTMVSRSIGNWSLRHCLRMCRDSTGQEIDGCSNGTLAEPGFYARATVSSPPANRALATAVEVYFCDPRSPWQRGSFAGAADATAAAIRYAEVFTTDERESKVWAPDETGRMRQVWAGQVTKPVKSPTPEELPVSD